MGAELSRSAQKAVACACVVLMMACACAAFAPQAYAANTTIDVGTLDGVKVGAQASSSKDKVRKQYKKVLKWAATGTHQFSKVYSKHSDHEYWLAEYSIRDINKNGVTDLFVRAGYSEADSLWYGFTVKKSGKIKYLGSVSGSHAALCKGKKGKTYIWRMHRGMTSYGRVKLSGGKLKMVKKDSVLDTAELAGYPAATKYKNKRKIQMLPMYALGDMSGINKVKAKK